VLALLLAREVRASGPRAFGVLRVDDLGLVFLLLLVVLTLAVSIYTVGWLRQAVAVGNMQADSVRFYFALVHAFVATMVVTVLEGTTEPGRLVGTFHTRRYNRRTTLRSGQFTAARADQVSRAA